jgi:hypothetical protein
MINKHAGLRPRDDYKNGGNFGLEMAFRIAKASQRGMRLAQRQTK